MKKKSIHFILPGNSLNSLHDTGYACPAAIADLLDNSLDANTLAVRVPREQPKQRRPGSKGQAAALVVSRGLSRVRT